MSSRRIARELAVILLPQLPKDKRRLAKVELEKLVGQAVNMLTEHAKQCLQEANSYVLKAQQTLVDEVIEHPSNVTQVHALRPVPLKSDQLQEHLSLMERALHLASEALDVPQIIVESKDTAFLIELVGAYIDHLEEIDKFISSAKAKWRLERMVSIDRDIIRLACAEAFFMPDVPINVCISEAVELSHRFADAKATKFINGVLSDLAQQAQIYRQTGTFTELKAVAETDSTATTGSENAEVQL